MVCAWGLGGSQETSLRDVWGCVRLISTAARCPSIPSSASQDLWHRCQAPLSGGRLLSLLCRGALLVLAAQVYDSPPLQEEKPVCPSLVAGTAAAGLLPMARSLSYRTLLPSRLHRPSRPSRSASVSPQVLEGQLGAKPLPGGREALEEMWLDSGMAQVVGWVRRAEVAHNGEGIGVRLLLAQHVCNALDGSWLQRPPVTHSLLHALPPHALRQALDGLFGLRQGGEGIDEELGVESISSKSRHGRR